MTTEILANEVITIPAVFDWEKRIGCACWVKARGELFRPCRKYAEFWMPTPWGSEVMACFTHANAKEVHLRA